MSIADEAETDLAICVIPLAVEANGRRHAGLVASDEIGFVVVPICVIHVIVCDIVRTPLYFPHKPRLSRRVNSLSCGPDAMIIIASCPGVFYKQPTSALFQIDAHISLLHHKGEGAMS